MSQLLSRLEKALGEVRDDVARAELLARKAIYLARTGSFEQAHQITLELRSKFSDGRHPHASVWLMLAEGLLHTFENMSPEGDDRVLRAHTLAVAMRDPELIANTAAWRAYWQFERWQFAGMVESVKRALASARAEDHDAQARVFMMLGNAFRYVGDDVHAQAAYSRCRHHALEAGDQATIDALIYNKVAFGLARLRVNRCFGESGEVSLDAYGREVLSAKSYQHIAGMEALSGFIYLVEARLMLLRGEFQQAASALEAIKSRRPFAAHHFHPALIDTEIAYCLAQLGRIDEAVPLLEQTKGVDFGSLDTDEQLVAAWLRSELAKKDPRLADQARAERELAEIKSTLSNALSELKAHLASVANLDFSIPTPLPPARSVQNEGGPQ